MGRKSLIVMMSLAGLSMFSLAVFAQQLGVDRGSDWGPGRKIIAATGLFIILLTILVLTSPLWQPLIDCAGSGMRQIRMMLFRIPLVQRFALSLQAICHACKGIWDRSWINRVLARVTSSPLARYCTETEDRKAVSAAAILGTLVMVSYFWFVSAGHWTNWPKTTSYYQQLGDAFAHGQVSLLEEPAPALLSLEDPYTFANREGIAHPWDVVFYQGKFYLYWGPAPALVVLLTGLISRVEFGDHKLVFIFVSGVFILSALLILRIRSRFFPSLRWVYVIPGILLAGFANPMLWLLNRPAVYEAAIASGQFFLISGIYFVFLALEKNRLEFWKLMLSGACLGLAVASRASLAYAALFLAMMIAGYVFRLGKLLPEKIRRLGSFALPLAMIAAALGWYNWVRFGDWLEFGFKYQLTGMNTHILTFSPANLLINLHNYFLNPYRLLSTFPYVKPRLGSLFIFFPIKSPSNYYSEHTTGILLTTPFILFALIPVVHLLWFAGKSATGAIKKIPFTDERSGDGLFRWTALSLAGGAFFAFAPILLYIAGIMRFLGDVMPLLVLLSTFGLLMARQYVDGKSTSVFWFNLLVIVLTLYSITVSLLLAVTGAEARFEHLNPILFDKLTRWFTP
jgi:hypothetical protein